MLLGQVLLGGTWTFTTYGKRHQQWIFLDSWHVSSEKILVFKFWLYLVIWFHGGRARLRSPCSQRKCFLFCSMPKLQNLQFWTVISENQLSQSLTLNRTRPFWAGSAVTEIGQKLTWDETHISSRNSGYNLHARFSVQTSLRLPQTSHYRLVETL